MRMNIRRRLLIYILPVMLLSTLVLSAMVLEGFLDMRDRSLESGERIGTLSLGRSDAAMQDQLKGGLSHVSQGSARQVDFLMGEMKDSAEMIAREMEEIVSRPALYPPREVMGPAHRDGEELSAYFTFAPGAVRDAAFLEEAGRFANAADFLLRTAERSRLLHSAYVASPAGFMLQADVYSELTYASPWDAEPIPFEMRERPWYVAAVSAGHAVFTDVVQDFYMDERSVTCAVPFYRGGTLAGVVGLDCFLKETEDIVLRSRVGERGVSLVVDRKGHILFSTENEGELAASASDLRASSDEALAWLGERAVSPVAGVEEREVLSGDYYISFVPLTNVDWTFVMLMDRTEMLEPLSVLREEVGEETRAQVAELDGWMRGAALAFALLSALVVLASAAVVCYLAGRFTEPLRKLSEDVRAVFMGGFRGDVPVARTGDEIESLALSVSEMTSAMRGFIEERERAAAEKERRGAEMTVARNIQAGLLPQALSREGLDLSALMEPAREVGGDFYDFYFVDESHLVLTIADVSDKGIPAALFMVASRTVLKNLALTMTGAGELGAVLSCAGTQLAESNEEMMFVTAFIALLDVRTGELTYASAGHTPPCIVRGGQVEEIKARPALPLGIRANVSYETGAARLAPGDLLVLYTDGVTEAMNEQKELYGERIKAALAATQGKSAAEALAYVRESVAAHAGSEPQSDDITMLAVRLV